MIDDEDVIVHLPEVDANAPTIFLYSSDLGLWRLFVLSPANHVSIH